MLHVVIVNYIIFLLPQDQFPSRDELKALSRETKLPSCYMSQWSVTLSHVLTLRIIFAEIRPVSRRAVGLDRKNN